MSAERGVIRNIGRAKQLNDFSGLLRPRNIRPTDIDGLIDYSGKAFLYIEGKVKGKHLSDEKGQKMALENVILSHWAAHHPSALVLFEHSVPIEQMVPVHSQDVRMIFTRQLVPFLCGQRNAETWWWRPAMQMSVISAIEKFEAYFNLFAQQQLHVEVIKYDKAEVEIINLNKGQFQSRDTLNFVSLSEASRAYESAVMECKHHNKNALISVRTYKGENATLIKNERL